MARAEIIKDDASARLLKRSGNTHGLSRVPQGRLFSNLDPQLSG
ncbi:hypothetical protein GCM10011503_06150 [Henriciella pelagia]|uniref:Uncharacterized protein n=1 Tax=Henriciella pelagia TaxID=1977912 RepID=A0ABQ1J5H7_9PROT|nr:hypothetical protein GCM10011503_06150 [Henriciella pelagia]